MKQVLGVILGGGRGTRLYPLTKYRSKPAVPIGGKYRLIDIPISNCIHSDVKKIYVLTQFNSASLNRHVMQTYRFDAFSNGFVEILAAEQTQENTDWYQGTADAVRQQQRHLTDHPADQVMILSGDHLYRMDYRLFVDAHRQKQADLTLAVKPVTRDAASELGILKVDSKGRVVDFKEKPQTDAELDQLQVDPVPGGNPDEVFLASMGIYVFERNVLQQVLNQNDEEDFGKHIIPGAIHNRRVYAYPFKGYWEDIGTIQAFFEANLNLTQPDPPFTFYHPTAPVFTHPRYLAASRLDGCVLRQSKVGEGSELRDTEVDRSIIGIRSVVGPNARISNTVMMGADDYDSPEDRARNREAGIPNMGIGSGCVIDGAIIDKNARIGEGVVIRNQRGVQEAETDSYVIRDGIVVIPKNAVIPSGTVI